ncbi:MAG: hypothetical protein ACE3JK_10350 [Sporolactobacillus sp.]
MGNECSAEEKHHAEKTIDYPRCLKVSRGYIDFMTEQSEWTPDALMFDPLTSSRRIRKFGLKLLINLSERLTHKPDERMYAKSHS